MAKSQRPAVGLAEIMRRNGVRQTDVVEALGTTRESVRLWCAGRCRPRLETALELVAYLQKHERGVTLRDIVGPADGGAR